MISENITFSFLIFLLTITFKTCIVYTAASLLILLLRKQSSVLKRTIWTMVIVSFVFLLIFPIFPSIWEISLDPAITNQKKLDFSDNLSNRTAAQIEEITNPDDNHRFPILSPLFKSLRTWSAVFVCLWAGGLFVFGYKFLTGHRYIKKIKRKALPADQKLNNILKSSSEKIGIRSQIKLKISDCLDTACTWGIINPSLFLPAESKAWSVSSIRMVLYHELAHVKNKDCLFELIAQWLCAVFWFNPIVWMAARKYRCEREKACDETVINNGVKSSEYASQLLRIVSSIKTRKTFFTESAVLFHKNGLRARLLAILNPKITKISQKMNRAVILILSVLFISLSLVSLQFGILGESLGRDALAYWSAVPGREMSAAFIFEKDISTSGFSIAMHALKQRGFPGSNKYYFRREEIDAVGRRLLESGHITEALEIFRLNAQMFPNNWQVYNSLGNAYQAKGDLKKAVSSYEKMLGLNVPNESKIRRHIAELKKNPATPL
jgi:beta-lactamase regulating signal transducer with metallopeptidase domain